MHDKTDRQMGPVPTAAQAQPSRRTIVQTAAWTIPVVAAVVAAPLSAASGCTNAAADVPLLWTSSGIPTNQNPTTNATLTRTGAFASSATGALSAVGVQVVHTFSGPVVSGSANAKPYDDDYMLFQRTSGVGNLGPNAYQDITFTFSEPLYNLRFSIWEITHQWSGSNRSYIDSVELTSPASYTHTKPAGSLVTGAGSSASPWKRTSDGPTPWQNVYGQVDIAFAGPVQSFTIRYRNAGYLNANPTQNVVDGHNVRVTKLIADRICPA